MINDRSRLFEMSTENNEVSLGRLCELVESMNAWLLESEQGLKNAFREVGERSRIELHCRFGGSGSGSFLDKFGAGLPMPSSIMVIWTTIRPDEVARRFLGVLTRGAVS